MKDEHNHECLSFGDALFLYLEREGMPLNVATVAQFEGKIGLEECIRFIEAKLPLLPRYTQRVVAPPFNIGLPCWEYDPDFDIRNHIKEVTLRRGTEAELKSVAAGLFSATMDRRRPLWDFTLVQGLKGEGTALIVRVHHCLADGISGVGMFATLMDATPAVRSIPKVKKFHAPKPKDPGSLLIDGMITSCFSAVQRLLTAQAELLDFAQQVTRSANTPNENETHVGLSSHASLASIEEITRMLPEFIATAERMPFNVVCRGPQKFEWAAISLPEIKDVKRCHGVTVNDVFLTLISAALRRYAERHGAKTAGRLLRVVVPVSIRGKDKITELGNRITFFPVAIPFSKSPRRLIASVRERTAILKSSRVADLVGFLGTVLGTVPSAVQALLGPIASALPIPAGNIICTQVPGPREALYLMGHRLLSCYPYVPIGGEFGMNCAVLTYNDVAHFGFSGDVNAVPDLEIIPKLMVEAFEELKMASGIKKRRVPRTRKAKVIPVVVERKQPAVAEEQKTMAAMAGD
jgi:diacylglycerol O-acyltransferase